MKRSLQVLLAAAILGYSAKVAAGLAADTVRVLKGGRGEEVAIVMLKPQSDGNALVRFTGTSSALDGLVLACKRSTSGHDEFYTTEWRGRKYSFVQVDLRGAAERWQLFAPTDVRRALPLKLDEAASRELKAKEVISLHEKQLKDGSLQSFASLHRDQEKAVHDRQLGESAAAAAKACGGALGARIAWDTVDDETLKHYSIASFCDPPLAALTALCGQAPAAAAILRDKVKDVTCSFSGPMKLALDSGTIRWTVNGEGSNAEEFARQALAAVEVAPAIPGGSGEAPPWGDGRTLGQRIALARTGVCTDDKNHFVVVAPRAADGEPRMYYGDGKRLARVLLSEMLGGGMFFEPRFVNPTANPNFRGADIRLQSEVEFDAGKQTCIARCGTRRTTLRVLPAPDAGKLLAAASFQPPLQQHTPHALTRDDRGNYYFVDKGNTPESARKFRLFVGPKGNLKLQAMTNVVSDSKGEIFSTRKGELRFILGKNGTESSWVAGKTRVPLIAVPVEENWQMIYTDLGVYLNEPLGTPCDSL